MGGMDGERAMTEAKSRRRRKPADEESPVLTPPTRGIGTIEAIIDAAERLWGDHGMEGASLREISIAAGSANKSSIGYHFGDKHGLIGAIFKARIPALEEHREPLLAAARAEGRLDDPVTLLRITFAPVFHAVDGDGRHRFAALLRAVNHYSLWDGQRAMQEHAPLAFYVLGLLRQLVPHLPQNLFDARIRLVNEICYGAATDQDDNPSAAGPDTVLAEQLFEDALRTSVYMIFLDS